MAGLMGVSLLWIGIYLIRKYSFVFRSLGMIVCMAGILLTLNFLTLHGILTVPTHKPAVLTASVPQLADGYQIIEMRALSDGYSPKQFIVKKDMPVRWVIDGQNIYGCQGFLISPKLGIQRTLSEGENVIEFIPKESGSIAFSCGMGLFQGALTVM